MGKPSSTPANSSTPSTQTSSDSVRTPRIFSTRWLMTFAITVTLGLSLQKLIPIADIGLSCHAKTLCSATYISLRNPDLVDIALECNPIVYWISSAQVLRESKQIRASTLFGLLSQTATFSGPYRGCVLQSPDPNTLLPEPSRVRKTLPNPEKQWPQGNQVDLSSDLAMDFENGLSQFITGNWSSRAIVVVKGGKIVYEKYGPGFSANTALLGWSMTKSVLNALLGIRAMEGGLSLTDPISKWIPEWRNTNKTQIKIKDLLNMNSGLEWVEGYTLQYGDVIPMLFGDASCSERPSRLPSIAPPGKIFNYASGTSNILSEVLRKSIIHDEAYWTYPARNLFEKIGADSFVLEADRTGTFVKSSYAYATARDWARFGLLYLNDGKWENQRILPEGWVNFTASPASGSKGIYGAHFWLTGRGLDPKEWEGRPNYMEHVESGAMMPEDTFMATGYAGQLTAIIPSKDVVIVRLGYNRQYLKMGELVSKVMEILSKAEQ